MILVNRPLTDDLRRALRQIKRRSSPFQATWTNTRLLLDHECHQLARPGVREVVLMIDVDESMLRLDGEIRANARPHSPMAALAIEGRSGPLVFPSGSFDDWASNVRAIALGMEALRKVERYGITPNAEQYTGFRAIGGGTPMPAATMTIDEAARLLLDGDPVATVNDIISHPEVQRAYYYAAAKRHHPDTGGDPAIFRRLTEARDLLAGAT